MRLSVSSVEIWYVKSFGGLETVPQNTYDTVHGKRMSFTGADLEIMPSLPKYNKHLIMSQLCTPVKKQLTDSGDNVQTGNCQSRRW